MIRSRFTSLFADNENVSRFCALHPGEPRQPFSRRFMFSRKDEPSSSVTPGILCDLRILELLRKVRSTGGSQPLSGSSSIDSPLSIMCTAFRERRMSLSCTLLPRWSTWYCNPSSCARQAVSFWMEASAYFWSAACKALGSGVGIVSWGSVGGVLHAARSRAAPGRGSLMSRAASSPESRCGSAGGVLALVVLDLSRLGKDQRDHKNTAENTSKGCPKTHRS